MRFAPDVFFGHTGSPEQLHLSRITVVALSGSDSQVINCSRCDHIAAQILDWMNTFVFRSVSLERLSTLFEEAASSRQTVLLTEGSWIWHWFKDTAQSPLGANVLTEDCANPRSCPRRPHRYRQRKTAFSSGSSIRTHTSRTSTAHARSSLTIRPKTTKC